MPKETFKYTNGEVTVVWKPNICIHSTICFSGLPEVFDPRERPWINIEGASTEKIIEQVKRCPSGALSFFMNDEGGSKSGKEAMETTEGKHSAASDQQDIIAQENAIVDIRIFSNGPIYIHNSCLIKHSDGRIEKKEGKITLCRCGGSQTKPYCDGSHRKNGFVG